MLAYLDELLKHAAYHNLMMSALLDDVHKAEDLKTKRLNDKAAYAHAEQRNVYLQIIGDLTHEDPTILPNPNRGHKGYYPEALALVQGACLHLYKLKKKPLNYMDSLGKTELYELTERTPEDTLENYPF